MNAPALNIARDSDALLAAITALPDAQAIDLIVKAWGNIAADLSVRWPAAHEALESVSAPDDMFFNDGTISPFAVIDAAAAQLREVVL